MPVTLSSASFDKYPALTLSNGNLTAAGTEDFLGNNMSVRATAAATGKRQFQMTLNTGVAYVIGVEDGTRDLSTGGAPGRSIAGGACWAAGTWGSELWKNGSAIWTDYNASAGVTTDDVRTCTFDTVAGEVRFYRTRSGTTVQIGPTITGISYTNWFAYIAPNINTATAKFDSGQARALDSGYSNYDSGAGSHSLSISSFSVGSPQIGVPLASYIHNLSISNFSVGALNNASPALTQKHALNIAHVSNAAPSIPSPAFGQRHAFSNTNFAVGSPEIGTPNLSGPGTTDLTIYAVELGSPTLGQPALTQRHAFSISAAGPATASVGTPYLAQRHGLAAAGFSTGSPDVGVPVLSLPAVDVPKLSLEYTLAADEEDRIIETYEERHLSADVEIRRLEYA